MFCSIASPFYLKFWRQDNVLLKQYSNTGTEGYMKSQRKDRLVLKTMGVMLVVMLFFFTQGAVVVINQMEGIPSILIRGAIIWALASVALIYHLIRYKAVEKLGFRKMEGGAGRSVLYFVPLFLIAFSHLTAGLALEEGAAFVLANLFLTLAIGMAEEIYFRGILCSMWQGRGVVKAMLVSSILFGFCHLLNVMGGASLGATALQICFAFVYGMVFALIFMIGKSLLPCVLLHALHDLCSFLSADASLPFTIILGSVQFVILLAYFVYLLMKQKKTNH